MQLFLSQYYNNIDKKGRVSVPANYRAMLSHEGFDGMIIYPSIKHNCLEGSSINRLMHLSNLIDTLDPYSDERDAFETVVMAVFQQINFDSEGRVLLNNKLIDHAGIKDKVCFVGKGKVFEIWNPEKFDEYLVKAKKIAHEKRFLLKNI